MKFHFIAHGMDRRFMEPEVTGLLAASTIVAGEVMR